MIHPEETREFEKGLIVVLMLFIIIAAIVLGGCDERKPAQNVRHCNVLYERGHAQPCRP